MTYFIRHLNRQVGLALIVCMTLGGAQHAQAEIDFVRDIQPILEFHCTSCHGANKDKGDYRLHTKELAFKGGEDDVGVVPGEPDKSPLYTTTILDRDDEDIMPPIKKDHDMPMTKLQTEQLRQWILEGAKWPDGVELADRKRAPTRIDFVEHIQPMLEKWCVSCHDANKDKGDLRIDTYELTMKGGENGACLVPGKPHESSLWTLTALPPDHDDIMPPKKGPMSDLEIYMLKRWIEEGAEWPEGLTLKAAQEEKEKAAFSPKKLFESLKFATEQDEASMASYTETIPGTEVKYSMVPIKGGTFTMGSPADEAGRLEDEGPQREIKIAPFWMGKTETTWQQYDLWGMDVDRFLREQEQRQPGPMDALADTILRPTEPYEDMTFGMGREGFPAICMTQLAAKSYCMWLSAKTGRFYRLPTEAEWEYACRAGTTTAYSFGDDASKLGLYAWHRKNSLFQYHEVGTKKPNPWGLYDMHGNVAEWVLDQYDPKGYAREDSLPVLVPTTLYPRTVRGGGWSGKPEALRSASRLASHEDWKQQDPQIPKSVWYHTDADFVGFRIIRPATLPPIEDLGKYWPTEEELKAVPSR